MKIKTLLGPRLIIRLADEVDNQTEDGVFVPQSAVNEVKIYDEAEIVDVGTGKVVGGPDIEFSVKVGDKVLLSRMAPKAFLRAVEVDGVSYKDFLMNDGEISAILD